MDKLYLTIGKNIKKFREACGASQHITAEALGYKSAVPISLIESGKRKISVENLIKLSEILDKKLEEFITPRPYNCSVCLDTKIMTSWGKEVQCVFCKK